MSYKQCCVERHIYMACEEHVAKNISPPNWHLRPVDFTRPDNWLPGITQAMVQVLQKIQSSQ